MQDRPDKEVLLDAVASFLVQQVRPAIADAGLNFRVLIAANLAGIVATEIRTGDAQDLAENERLRALLPDLGAAGTRELNRVLTDRIRSGAFDDAAIVGVTAHVKQTLMEKLAVTNPRFETMLDIEN
jgi:hypothetical protein